MPYQVLLLLFNDIIAHALKKRTFSYLNITNVLLHKFLGKVDGGGGGGTYLNDPLA